jgi:hypothetical protein
VGGGACYAKLAGGVANANIPGWTNLELVLRKGFLQRYLKDQDCRFSFPSVH